MLATTRDALYGWTAERLVAQADGGRRAVVPLLLRSRLSGRRVGGAARLPRQRAALRVRHGRQDAAALAGGPRDAGRDSGSSDAMIGYWAAFARTGVPTAHRQAAMAAYGTNRAYMAFEDAPRPKTHLMPGMYELDEQVVCRRRAAGRIPWHWNVGLASPPLPAEVPQCR